MDQATAQISKLLKLSAFLLTPLTLNSAYVEASSLPSLRYLLVKGSEGAQWKSVLHRHYYTNPDLELAVKAIIDDLTQGNLEASLASLSQEERDQLSFDSLDSRTDLVDLLSVELKLRVEDSWRQKIGADVSFDSSEIWSLAKYRLKKLFSPDTPLNTGITLFRAPGMTSTDVVFACADPAGLQFSPRPKEAIDIRIAGIHLSRQNFSNRPQVDVLCGTRRFQFQSRTDSLPKSWKPQKPNELFKGRDSIEILGSVGLTASVSQMTYSLMKKMIEWRGGFNLIEERDVKLKPTFSELLESADLLNLAADIPNGNRFRLMLQAEVGKKLTFRKTLETAGKLSQLNLVIISPPIRSQETLEVLKTQQGVEYSFDELTNLIRKRKRPVALIDLTCFSTKHIKNWIPVLIESGASTGWIAGSHRGQAGETLLDVFPQLDLMLSVYDHILRGQSLDEIERTLSAGTVVGHSISSLFGLLDKMGMKKSFNPSFLPITNFDKSLEPFNSSTLRKTLFLKEIQTGLIRRYNPSSSL